MPKRPSPPQIKKRILEVAGQIFADQGFRATTIRQITRKAGVNVAAVNYHYRDKQELYLAVLRHAHQAAARTAQADLAGTPKERLAAFIHHFMGYLLDPHRPAWHGRLISREMIEPTPALDQLVEESIQPVKKQLHRILIELLGPDVPENKVRRCCFSVIGQCIYYVHCREMILRLFPEERTSLNIHDLTEHITQFSLAGIERIRSGKHEPVARTIFRRIFSQPSLPKGRP